MTDKSFHISNVTGDIQIAQDSASISNVQISSADLANRLTYAATSDQAAERFVDWIIANHDKLEGAVSSDQIVGQVDQATLTSEKRSILKRIATTLSIAASSSTVITAVVHAIEALTK